MALEPDGEFDDAFDPSIQDAELGDPKSWPKNNWRYVGRREVYVASLEHRDEFRRRGYKPVDVRALPRGTPSDDARAILAWLQGMSEGTIPLDTERRRVLELEAKAAGLFSQQAVRVNVNVDTSAKTLEELLNFGSSRRLLRMGATLETIEAAQRASVDPVIAQSLEKMLDGKH